MPTLLRVWLGAACVFFVTFCVVAVTLGGAWSGLINRDRAEAARIVDLKEDEIRTRLSMLAETVRAAAAMPSFEAPDDGGRDDYRFSLVPASWARRVIAIERVQTLLSSPTELSLLSSASGLGSGLIDLWKITRGLPLRDGHGKYLARTRRLTAEAFIRGMRCESCSMAEIDDSGRIVFMTPYRTQLELAKFKVFDLNPKPLNGGLYSFWRRTAESNDEIAYVTSINRPGKPRWLAASITTSELLRSIDQTPVSLVELTTTGPQAARQILHRNQRPPQGFWNAEYRPESARGTTRIDNLILTVNAEASSASMRTSLARAILQILACVALLTIAGAHLVVRLIGMTEDRDSDLGSIERRSLSRINVLVHNMRNNLQSFRNLLASTQVAPAVKNRLWEPLRQLTEKVDSLPSQIQGLFWPEEIAAPSAQSSICIVHAVLNEIEMRSYLRDKLKFEDAALNAADYFCRISQADISVILSHVLTNGRESATKSKTRKTEPTVEVRLSRNGEVIQLRVSDDGSGIPPEIRTELFNDGVSTKQTSGGRSRGNGLYTSRLLCEKWGGRIEVETTGSTGTVMLIELEAAAPPPGIVTRVTLKNCRRVIVVDDDDEIARLWEEILDRRLSDRLPASLRPEVQLINSPEALVDYIREVGAEPIDGETFFLIDNQFNNSRITGLDLILEQNLADRAVLVTNYSEDAQVLHLLQGRKILLLPKWSMRYLMFDISLQEVNSA